MIQAIISDTDLSGCGTVAIVLGKELPQSHQNEQNHAKDQAIHAI